MRQPSGTSWRATAAPCTPPPTPHWSIPSKSTPRWRTRSPKPAARRPAFSTRSDQCPAGSRTSPGSASPPDSQSADPRTKNRSTNGFPPVDLLDLDVDWGLGHEEDDENLRPAPPARARAVHRERGPRDGSASHTPPFEQRQHFRSASFNLFAGRDLYALCPSWPSRPATCWRSTGRGTPSRRRTRCAVGSRVRTAVMALTLLVMVVHDVDVVPRSVKYDFL